MRRSLWKAIPAVMALALQVWAGGFFLTLESPDANPEARKLNAVLTVKMDGCHDPASAKVTGTAIGTVNGERKEIPLDLRALSTPGLYAVTQQWPKLGRWVLQFTASLDTMFTNVLVTATPEGIGKDAKGDSRAFTAAEISAMLR